MLVHAAEDSFHKGLEHLDQGLKKEALAFFNGALEIERRMGGENHQARYLSYYGLSLQLTGGSRHEAVRYCRAAAKVEGYRPEICLNLGRVLLAANRRREAHKTLHWGLRMQPGHRQIVRELKKMGLRRKPPLPFLPRTNTLNVLLGRMRRAPA